MREKKRAKRGWLLWALLGFVLVTAAGCAEDFSLEKIHHDLNIWHIPHGPWHLGTVAGFSVDVNPSTIIFTWVAMILTLLIALAAVRGADVRRPTKMQALFEIMLESFRGLVYDSMGEKKGRPLYYLFVTFFYFILICNLLGLVPTCVAPTADINTTLGLAIITFVLMYVWGLKYKGPKLFLHYFYPIPLLPIIEDLAKPVTLAFRLYGNMYGKEVMLLALLGLIRGAAEWCGGFTASVIWLAFGVFVSFIQAFVFAVLSIAYISLASAEDH
ncbi:ATP synthase F0, A subunit [Ammonifex degensii KC4]|uniref:ATP synthase subunit a n=1 Tax=Ammonifex degensii (strain DSM 10501 / KC4) TaxID=429009 RepID=C9RAE4_AMMDK|nr:F0F1 ATP synthase subunit A [Ammonifex degensii]ACX51253.1 ATP synthase F0, A subunit [Ammonifex degensii KC4]